MGSANLKLNNLVKYTIPLIFAYSSDMLMSTIDTAFVGNLGAVEMASIGFSAIFIWTLYNLFKGILLCVGTFVSNCYGRKDLDGAKSALWNGLIIAFLASSIIFVARYAFPIILKYLILPSDVLASSNLYINIRLTGAIGFLSSITFASYFRGVNKPRYVLYASISSNLLNVILDYIFIYVLHFGIAGAAVATVLSQFLCLGIYFTIYLANETKFKFLDQIKTVSQPQIKQILSLGIPYTLKIFAEVFIYLAFTTMIGWLGTAELAATSIMNQIFIFVGACAHAVGGAAQALVGQNIGSGDMKIAKSYGLLAIVLNISVTTIFSIIIIIFNKDICFIFNQNPEVIRNFSLIVIVGTIALCFDGVHMVAGCALAGARDTVFQFKMTMLLGYVMFLPLTYYFISSFNNSLTISWVLMATFMFLMAMILSMRFKFFRFAYIK